MLQMTCDTFEHLLVPYLWLYHFEFFIFFTPFNFISKWLHFSYCDIFIFHLSSIFKSLIFVLIILSISSIFMLTLGHHLAMWCALVRVSTFFSYSIHFFILVFYDHFMSCWVILWSFIQFYDHLLRFRISGTSILKFDPYENWLFDLSFLRIN